MPIGAPGGGPIGGRPHVGPGSAAPTAAPEGTAVHAIRRAADPAVRVAHALRRPRTYAGHVREATSTVVTAGVWPLGFATRGAGDLDGPSSVATPVVLVHGYGANKSNWVFLARYLDQAGFGRRHAVNYNPLTADIPRLAEQLAVEVEAVRARTGAPRVHLVGHSLGGIIARYAVQVHGLEDVATVITVASPHGGVRLARYGSPLSAVSPLASGLQLRPDSPVMSLLRASARPSDTRWVAYYSNLDLIVPARRAMILEPELAAANVLVKDHGHLSIMLSRRLAHSVVDQLGAVEGLPGYGAPVGTLGHGHPGAVPPAPEASATG